MLRGSRASGTTTAAAALFALHHFPPVINKVEKTKDYFHCCHKLSRQYGGKLLRPEADS